MLNYKRGNFSVIFFLFLGLFSAWNIDSFSQNYRFRNYGPEDGLSDNFIYNIIQGRDGYLWLGTGEGICRFDGFAFAREFPGDSLPMSPVRRSFIDSRNLVWFGYDNGSIAVLDGIKFRLIEPDGNQRNTIKGFAEDKNGDILVATQGKGIIKIAKDYSLSYINEGLEGLLLSSIHITKKGDILAGTFDGLFLLSYSPDNNKIEQAGRFEEIPYTNVQVIRKSPGRDEYFIGTQEEGAFLVSEPDQNRSNYTIKAIGHEFGMEYTNIQDIFEDSEGSLWLSSEGQGVIKLLPGNGAFKEKVLFNEAKGLFSRYIRCIYEDLEGNLWFASYGNGLSVLRNQYFSFYSFLDDNFSDDIISVYSENNIYWLGSDKGILKVDLGGEESKPRFIGTGYGLPDDKITSIVKSPDGIIYIGTGKSGIYRMLPNSARVQRFDISSNSLENIINSLAINNSRLFAATNGGLVIYDLKKNERTRVTTFEGLPHNRIRYVFIDSKKNTWIATRSNGIYNIEEKSELTIESGAEMEFVSIVEDKEGNLWAATSGDGVFKFSRENPEQYTTVNGMRSNYCYSLAIDENGMIWVGHSLGMSRIDPNEDQVQVFGVEQGISAGCNYNSVLKNSNKELVIGTTQGLIIYDHTREKYNSDPPRLNITSLKINDIDYDFSKPVLLPYSRYKIRIDFIGINLRNPEKATYQFKLDGYDDWSEMSSLNFAYYSRIEDGNYTFLLRACNEQGVCTEVPEAMIKLSIKIPVWKTWWFILAVILSLILAVYLLIKQRERKQKQIQEYLEKLLDERTREVVAQKEEIENKNRDITDSINYAQRIQASILPPVKRLLDHFSGSFVFYQPKDIVSGDFYWYDRVWGNKFLVVCADSTGHGVPGAFMSMIGTTLIKDICSRPEVRSPASLLLKLDQEIKEALHQNKEAEKSNDGMDIIVAEIDLDTKELRVASAMRPLILYINSQQVYVKGSRSAVGGRVDEDSEEKEFTDEHYALSKGDIVYMFSDGYPDQFGGPLGKKFKMVRLKNLLRDIHDKPMEEQYQYIKSNFMLWKEELEQVDDVLFMGIKI